MAYSFNGSNQFLSTTSSPVSATPLTIFARANSAVAPNGPFFAIKRNGSQDQFAVQFGGSTFPVNVTFTVRAPPASAVFTITTSGVAQNTWAAATGLSANDSSRFSFRDTVKSAQNTTTITPLSSSMELRVGFDGISGYFNGLVAETAIWNTDLTDDEVTSLARGFKPFRVRPQNLQFYSPIVRGLQDLRGGVSITNNNTATVADHPRVY